MSDLDLNIFLITFQSQILENLDTYLSIPLEINEMVKKI